MFSDIPKIHFTNPAYRNINLLLLIVIDRA